MDFVTILSSFGWGGVIVIAVLLIFTGRLLPKSVVDAITSQAAKEAEQWRIAFEKSEQARLETQHLLTKSIEVTEATARVVKEFNAVASGKEDA